MSEIYAQGLAAYDGPETLTLEEWEQKVASLMRRAEEAHKQYGWAREQTQIIGQAPELVSHRARVLADAISALAGAAYHLQRAAYERATK